MDPAKTIAQIIAKDWTYGKKGELMASLSGWYSAGGFKPTLGNVREHFHQLKGRMPTKSEDQTAKDLGAR